MRNRGLVLIAITLILAGVMLLIGNIFDINLWAFCFPVGLIVLGIFVLLRPRMVSPGTKSHFMLIGEIERGGDWEVTDEEYWTFVADVEYDLTKASVPPGETTIRGYGFVGDVEIFAPRDIGLGLDLGSFVTSLKVDGQDEETTILAPVHWRSDGYKAAERRVRFELAQFVGDIKVRFF